MNMRMQANNIQKLARNFVQVCDNMLSRIWWNFFMLLRPDFGRVLMTSSISPARRDLWCSWHNSQWGNLQQKCRFLFQFWSKADFALVRLCTGLSVVLYTQVPSRGSYSVAVITRKLWHRDNEDGTTIVALVVGFLTSEQEDEEFEDEEFEVELELLEVDELELDSLEEEVGRRGCRTFRRWYFTMASA